MFFKNKLTNYYMACLGGSEVGTLNTKPWKQNVEEAKVVCSTKLYHEFVVCKKSALFNSKIKSCSWE